MRNHVLGTRSRATGLVLAGLCLLLPFVTGSCTAPEQPRMQWKITWTDLGLLAGGRPDLDFTQDSDKEPMRRLDAEGVRDLMGTPTPPTVPPQPVAWLAVTLMLASLAASAAPSRIWRPALTAGFAVAAVIVLTGATLLARSAAVDTVATAIGRIPPGRDPRAWEHYNLLNDSFSLAYGHWLAILTLSLVAMAALIDLIRQREPG